MTYLMSNNIFYNEVYQGQTDYRKYKVEGIVIVSHHITFQQMLKEVC
jgi:hypothetical protein